MPIHGVRLDKPLEASILACVGRHIILLSLYGRKRRDEKQDDEKDREVVAFGLHAEASSGEQQHGH
ncbi:MAG: hypothetical protein ABIO65_11995 [Nitrospiria bacterium]